MRLRLFASGLIAVAIVASLARISAAQAEKQPRVPDSRAAAQHQSASAKGGPAEEGERVFKQNCSRCHNAPEGFSPRISGTIARHMRVRANLSRHDQEALVRFLNP
jgi:cytochrome c5